MFRVVFLLIFCWLGPIFASTLAWAQSPDAAEPVVSSAPAGDDAAQLTSEPSTPDAMSQVPEMSHQLGSSSYIGQIIFSLIFVLILIFVGAWLMKRFGRVQGVAGDAMKVLSVMSVGQKERIVLMQVGQEQYLVGVTTAKISLLQKLETPIEVSSASQLPNAGAFANRLQEALARTRATGASGSAKNQGRSESS